MRDVTYKIHFPYGGKPEVKRASLADLALDIPYLVNPAGVIPTLERLNLTLSTGGNSGGMSVGVTWKPFQIDQDEFDEMVSYLLTTDINELKRRHRWLWTSNLKLSE